MSRTTRLARLNLTLGAALAAALASQASAQVVSSEMFEIAGTPWTVNGIETLFDDGRGIDNQYIGLPFGDFFGVHLRTEDARSGLLGDLTRYPNGLTISFDIRTFVFENFNREPIDPASRPIILQLTDRGDPDDFSDDVSVWFAGDHIPGMNDGWRRLTFTIPDPTSTTLPPGWGGTGDEDPVTFEPRLPPSRTYTSVLRSVDDAVFTTFQPGYFYGFSFWEMGFDNVRVEQTTPACACDVTGDNATTIQDIFDFLAAYFSGNLALADFNDSGDISVEDIFGFLACWFGGC